MKYLLVVLAIGCSNLCFGQFDDVVTVTATALVGDEVRVGGVGPISSDPGGCGNINGSVFGPWTGPNWYITRTFEPFSTAFYFKPETVGDFSQEFYAVWGYTEGQYQCPNRSLRVKANCTALPADTSIILPKDYVIPIYPNFEEKKYEDTLHVIYRNNRADSVKILQVGFATDVPDELELAYADGSPLFATYIIPPFQRYDTIPIRVTLRSGPTKSGLVVKGSLMITGEMQGVQFYDLLNIELSFASMYWDGQIGASHSTLSFNATMGDTVYETVTITYGEIIKELRFDPIPSSTGFAITNIDHQPGKDIVEIRCTPRKTGTQNHTLKFKYVVDLFDNTEQELESVKTVALRSTTIPSAVQEVDILPVKVAPNPAKDLLTVTRSIAGDEQMEIFDMIGRKVFTTQIQGHMSQIDIAHLTPGIYLLKTGGTALKLVIE